MTEPDDRKAMERELIQPHYLFADAGKALFGETWQGDMERFLQVDRRTVSRWISGDMTVPAGVWREIDDLIEVRRKRLIEVARVIGELRSREEGLE